MAPKVARTQSPYETGEGISTMRRLLNDLQRPRAGLHTELFFEEGGVHSLGLSWTSQVPVAVENNMPKEKWFTPNPFLAKSGISSSKWSNHRRGFPLMKDEGWTQWIGEFEPTFKQKWMNNGIYELIVRAKISVENDPRTSAQLPKGLALWMCSRALAC